ncbi:transposase, partial [Streptomyces sp. NPDC020192]|uniref:transposase n=1 Tax=Streptomyces sp. NPDC020192 TaxID=3365066 RepID=UPI00379F60C1
LGREPVYRELHCVVQTSATKQPPSPRGWKRLTDALEAAAHTRGGSLDGAIFHSDNGAQYASKEFAKVCSRLGVIRLRGAVGTSGDNAAAESFNATLKRETLQGKKRWSGVREARFAVFRWHSGLGYISPIAFEQRSVTLTAAA